MPIISVEIMKTIDERETKQKNKTTKKEKSKGVTQAVVKG